MPVVVAGAGDRHRDRGGGPVAAVVDARLADAPSASSVPARNPSIAVPTSRVADVVGLDDDHRSDVLARERVPGSGRRSAPPGVPRAATRRRCCRLHADRRDREREQRAAGEHRRQRRSPQDAIDERAARPRPRRRAAARGTSPETGSAPARRGRRARPVRPAGRSAKPTSRLATTSIVPIPNDTNVASPGQEHSRPSPRSRSGPRRAPPGPRSPRRSAALLLGCVPQRRLLALTAQVEQRVVDADGEPDQQDDRGDVLVDREQLAGIATRPNVAITAEIASSSGTPAATSDPKATSRISSVIGSDSAPRLRDVLGEAVVERLVGAERRRTPRSLTRGDGRPLR